MSIPTQILEIQSGKYKGRQVRVSSQEVIVGRDEQAKVRIASEEVSRQHCALLATAEGVLVRDLESSNGTFVNGRPIRSETLLEPGGTLAVGPMSFKLLGKPKATAKPAPVKMPKTGNADASVLDHDIASWLSDEPSASDTTIIQMPSGDSSVEIPVSSMDLPALNIPGSSPARRKDFKSTAEEAQDIIARWQAAQGE